MCTKYCAGLRILSSFDLLAVSNLDHAGYSGYMGVKKSEHFLGIQE